MATHVARISNCGHARCFHPAVGDRLSSTVPEAIMFIPVEKFESLFAASRAVTAYATL
jgi:hypothetical protein